VAVLVRLDGIQMVFLHISSVLTKKPVSLMVLIRQNSYDLISMVFMALPITVVLFQKKKMMFGTMLITP
jgi:hypothetical protein